MDDWISYYNRLPPLAGAPALPRGWRNTQAGRVVLNVAERVGQPDWSLMTVEARRKWSCVYHAIVEQGDIGRTPSAEPTSVLAGRLVAQLSSFDDGSSWSYLQRLAWFGDLIHRFDVRVASFVLSTADVSRGSFCNLLESNHSQAQYYLSLPLSEQLFVPGGNSAHSVATAFEASYTKVAFRRSYLNSTFGEIYAAAIVSFSSFNSSC